MKKQQKNLIERIKSETPDFFKSIRKYALSLSAIAGILLGAPSLVPGFEISPLITSVCNYALVAGLVAGGVSSTTVVNPEKGSK